MATKTSSRQIVNKDALANIGSTAGQELDSILSDIDSVIVTKDGTQTITNKTIDGDSNTVQDLPLTAHKTVVGDAGEVWQYDGSGVPTSSKTLNDMSITSPSRLDVKKDTKANLETYAATATNGQFVFATDEKKAYQIIDNALAPVGGGGVGGSEIFASYNSDDDSSTWDSGNNATFLGGGTLSSTFNQANATNPLHGDSSYTLTLSSGSLNDYVSTEIIPVPLMAQKNTCVVRTKYMYDGNDNDVSLVVYDVTNSAVVGEKLLPKQLISKLCEYIFNVPDTCVNLRVGFQVKVANNTKVLKWDDLEVSLWTPQVANLIPDTEWTSYTPIFTSFGTVSISYFKYKRVGDSVHIKGQFNSGIRSGDVLSFTLPNGLIAKDINPTGGIYWVNGVFFRRVTNQIYALQSNVSATGLTNLVRFSSAYVYSGTPDGSNGYFLTGNYILDNETLVVDATIPIEGWKSQSENIVQAWEPGAEWTSYTPTFSNMGATPTGIAVKYKRNGSDLIIIGKWTSAGTGAGAVASMSLPQGLIASVSELQIVGEVSPNLGDGDNYVAIVDVGSSVINFGKQSSARNPFAKVDGNIIHTGAGVNVGIRARIPILGWSSSPTLLALPTSKENVFSAVIDSSGNVITKSGDWINSIVKNGAGDYTINYSKLSLSLAPSVHATPRLSSGYATNNNDAPTITSARIKIYTDSGAASDVGFFVLIQKQGADYTPPGVFVGDVAKEQICYLKDVKPSGSGGGTSFSNTWGTRTLNTIEGDSSIVSLNSNQFTLQAGVYDIEASAPTCQVNNSQGAIYNVTDSTYVISGQANYAYNTTSYPQAFNHVMGRLFLTSQKTFEYRNFTGASVAAYGLGQNITTGQNNVFAQVKIRKLNGN